MISFQKTVLGLLLALLTVACGSGTSLPTSAAPAATTIATAPAAQDTPAPSSMPATAAASSSTNEVPSTAPAATAQPTETPTPAPWRVRAEPGTPLDLIEAMRDLVASHPAQFVLATDGQPADVTLAPERGEPLATWIYALAVPFATLDESTTLVDLQNNWRAGGSPQALVDGTVGPLLAQTWGQGAGRVVSSEDLLGQVWAQRPAWTLVPFHRLEPGFKVLPVDGVSPLAADFDVQDYPLAFEIGLDGDPAAVAALRSAWDGPLSNRQEQHITRVAMSGVTALVRATAYQMEIRGIGYPGEEVAPVMRAADLAHVSNEVSFVPDCPPPHYIGDPVFCSDPRYLALLEDIGVDIVELTGNHLNDWGAQFLPYSLDLYAQAGMRTFGGGSDLAQAQQPLLVEHNGNLIAFVGCNPVGPFGAWATAERPGAAPCDAASFQAQISALRDEGRVVIATQQYQELYNYAPSAQQQADFRALATAGAAAVSGSQGHHVQGFDFHDGAFIHYGLGNLFFDQMDLMGTRQTTVDTYTIYENRLLNVQVWTGLIENYARPRLMTAAERRDLLQTLFTASGW